MSCCVTPFASQVEPSNAAFISLLAPFPADGVKEAINFNLPQNQPLVTVPFSVQKLTNNLDLTGWSIVNTQDATPLTGISFDVVNFATSSMTILLNCNLDTSHYYLKTIVFVVGS